MVLESDERDRPSEWLRNLRETRSGYARLLRQSGSIALAAYRVASAKCRASAVFATSVPTLREVHAAACELVENAGPPEQAVPSISGLGMDCELAGLVVIGAARPRWAI